MNFKPGDYVTRKSHNNDVIFKIIKISDNNAYLKGVYDRLYADALIEDLIESKENEDSFKYESICNRSTNEYFYLPGKILHIDGDSEYLEKCLRFYKANQIYAIGKKLTESEIAVQIKELLEKYKPEIVVITGHDAYYSKKATSDEEKYQNSVNFIKAVKQARDYEKSHDKLIIIAGACQSDYENLIKAGANFASSPKRINIHALDPAIVASSIALTKNSEDIDLVNILNKTKYGSDGIGGIITRGVMYVGFPR